MKKKLLLLCFTLCAATWVIAQNRIITGQVTGVDDNSALPGVNVLVKGTNTGTVTDFNGTYKLEVDTNSTLVFSFVGYATVEIVAGNRTVIDVALETDAEQLDEVVVTALGISRERRSLTYASQEVKGDELSGVKDASFINALSGKAAGVFINRSGSGVGGSTRVVLRGNSSTRNNNVLYVIDGIPMNNITTSQPTDVWGQNNDGSGGAGRDGGDGIGNLNPEDIESINVLKGASAAALYGSQAANGVILITTKKGSAGQTRINFSSNFTTESILQKPELQYSYGQTADGTQDSWGAAVNAPDHVSDFFNTGTTWINSISLSGGSESAQTYFSYANTNSNGILPTSEFNKHNFTFRENAQFLNDKLNVSGNINFITQEAKNRAVSGLYFNPLTGLYFFPRGLDFNNYEENFEVYSAARNTNVQNWIADRDIQQNPYWILNRNRNFDRRTRFLTSAAVSYELNDWLSIKARGSADKSFDTYDQRSFASTQGTLADVNGRYVLQRTQASQYYGDVILSLNKTSESISVNANLGASIMDRSQITDYFDSQGAGGGSGLQFANVFNLQNIAQPGNTAKQFGSEEQLQSVFGSVNIGLNGTFFLDVTGRNDWSSTLAFTSTESFFYPSVGLTGVLSELFDVPGFDLLKVRASYAEVGNGVNAFDTRVLKQITPAGVTTPDARVPEGEELKPELNKSYEIGLEIAGLDKRLNLDLTYYNSTTEDQRIAIDAPPGVGVNRFLVNAGQISNSGIEAALRFLAVDNPNFKWTAQVNYTKNTNKVEKLTDRLAEGEFFLSEAGVNNYALAITEGGSFGDLYGRKFQRNDQGAIVVDADGAPLPADGGLELIGNSNPDYQLSINNTIDFKGLSVKVLFDGRFGGEVMSITEAINDELGVSQTTADARDNGGVNANAVYADGSAFNGPINAQTFYQAVGGRAGITEHYIYDATNVRLRELSIGYQLPDSFVKKLGPISRAKISLVGRNLFFLKNNAPFDPDISMSTGTGLQGVHVFALPSTRSIGFNISLSL